MSDVEALSAVIKGLAAPVLLRNAESGEIVAASEGVQHLLRRPVESLLGAGYRDQMSAEHLRAADAVFAAARQEGGRRMVTYSLSTEADQPVPVREVVWVVNDLGQDYLVSELSSVDEERKDSVEVASRTVQILHTIWDLFAQSRHYPEVVEAAVRSLMELVGFEEFRIHRGTRQLDPAARDQDGSRGSATDVDAPPVLDATDPIRRVQNLARPLWIERISEERDWPRGQGLVEHGFKSALYVGIPLDIGNEAVIELLARRSLRPDEALMDTVMDVAIVLGRMSEREQAEAVLHRREEQFRKIIEWAHDAFISLDDQGQVTEWNRQSEQTFGWSRSEAVGRPLTELIIPEALHDDHRNGFQRFLNGGPSRVMNRRVALPARRRDGSTLKVQLTIWPLKMGDTWAFNAFLHDVTQKELAEAEREERERQLEQAQRIARLGSWEWDILEDRISWSKELFRIFGEDPESYRPSYEALAMRVHEDDRTQFREAVQATIDSGGSFSIEPRFVGRDGNEIRVLSQGEAVRDGSGRVVRMRGIAQDLTERAALEEARRRLEVELAASREAERGREALQQSVEQYRFMTNSIPQQVWTARPNGDLDFFNAVAKEFFGLGSDELTAERWLEFVHPEDLSAFYETWAQAIRGGEPYETALRLRSPDGGFRWFLSRANPQLDPLGNVIRWYGTNTDIHARKEAEESRRLALDELAAANALLAEERELLQERSEQLQALTTALAASNKDLDQFAYVASHDLRAPLRGISNLTRYLTEDLGESLKEETAELLQLLRDRVQRMDALISGILTYSRAGRTIPDPEPVDTGVLVRELFDLLPRDPEMVLEVASDLPKLNTARAPLEQVFLNLITNSVTYGTKDGKGKVEVSWRDQGSMCLFLIRDHGPGIPSSLQTRIWQIFQTLQPADEYGGTGLGLSVVKKLVERFGGTVAVESEEGRGATFSFTWPKELTAFRDAED